MHTLKTSSTFGNFKFEAEAKVTDEQLAILASAGLLQALQRSPATAAEKELAGYEKRPASFKRSSIDFSEANATVLAKHLSEIEVEGEPAIGADGKEVAGAKSKLSILVTTAEHVPNAGAEPKYAEEKRTIGLYLTSGTTPGKLTNGEPRTATSFANNRGITPPADDATWQDDTEFLSAVRDWARAEKSKAD